MATAMTLEVETPEFVNDPIPTHVSSPKVDNYLKMNATERWTYSITKYVLNMLRVSSAQNVHFYLKLKSL
jgi:hypothetical protein